MAKTTAKDFFLWAGALIALYGSVTALITLLFEYVNRVFPDPLAYAGDPYGGAVRFGMATLIVLAPTTLVLFRLIRGTIKEDPAKADIWVRRWALVLTLFIAGAAVVIDLITVLNTFLSGEIGERFVLKAAIVLLVAVGVFLHFLADLKGYWIREPKKANLVGIAAGVLALAVVIGGFFIVGSPQEVRGLRFDEQKVGDLQSIQYQVIYFWQLKRTLPADIAELNDPLSNYSVPTNPETGEPYRYVRTSDSSFDLCTVFNSETPDTAGQGQFQGRDIAYTATGPQPDENWKHPAGEHCYSRTIDPERYPPFEKPVR